MRFSKEVKIALFAVAALIFLFFGYRFLRGTDFFSSSRTFYVYYQNVEGLETSNPVLVNGLTVGKVIDLELLQDKGNQIRVTLDVDKKVRVGDGTVASLTSSSLLGGKAITLRMGPNTVIYNGGDTLIPESKGSITDQLAEQAMPLMETIDSTIRNINTFFTPKSQRSLEQTLVNFEGSSATLNQIMLENQRNINQISRNVNSLTSALLGTQRKIDMLAANLNAISDTVKRADVGRVIRNANQAMTEMRSAIAKVDNAQGTLGMLINDRALYNNMTRATADLDRLMVDFKANPKRYVHFSVFGKKNKESGKIELEVDEPGSQMGPNPNYKPEENQPPASREGSTDTARPKSDLSPADMQSPDIAAPADTAGP